MIGLPLGDTGWTVWQDAVLRSPGFPAEGLRLAPSSDVAAAADRLLTPGAGPAEEEAFDTALTLATAAGGRALSRIAADPLLREAVTWQNPDMIAMLDGIVGSDPERRTSTRRKRETRLLRYWQRYCGKNETIGFFGPICWVRLDPDPGTRVRARPGPGLVRDGRVFLERWVVAGYAERLAADPRVRQWLAPRTSVEVAVEGRRALRPMRPPVELSVSDAAVLHALDGRPARAVARTVTADPTSGLRSEADVSLALERLVARGLVTWQFALPVAPEADRTLADQLAEIADPEVREPAMAGLDRLRDARDAVAAAAGDPSALARALEDLDATVVSVTGGAARREPGAAYAGRTPCYQDAVRDVEVVIGAGLLDDLAAPLLPVLQAARWLTVRLAEAYTAALEDLHEDGMRLGDLLSLALGLFWGKGGRPLDEVAEEFAARWAALFELDGDGHGAASVTRLEVDPTALARRAERLFATERPGWSGGLLHSPDIQLCATDAEALQRGDYLAVLGELHAARPTLDFFIPWHPEPGRLWGQLDALLGADRMRPLYPADWPRNTGRVALAPGPSGTRVGFAPAPPPASGTWLPAMSVRLERQDGALVAVAPDGRSWPLVEVVGEWLSLHALDAFKLPAAGGHQPRITVGRLVVARQTWRTTIDETGLVAATTPRDRYLAVRRWRATRGLPDRVFVKLDTETKPTYADLTCPQHVAALCGLVRAARRDGGGEVAVTVTEMLPDADRAWLPDAAGRTYLSELRLHVVDPVADRSVS